MAQNLTRHWRILSGLTTVTMFAAFALPYLAPPPDLDEKRALADLPAWPNSASTLKDFRLGIDRYVADRFPARPYLIGGLNRLRLLAGVSGSERVIVGRDGWLFFNNDSLNVARGDPALADAEARAWLQGLAGRTEALRARGITYLVVSAPLKETIYPGFGPSWYHGPNPNRASVVLTHMAAKSGAGEMLNLYDAVAEPTHWGLKTYSRHDTHWTGLGAYQGYAAIMARLHELGAGEAPRSLSEFVLLPSSRYQPRDLALMLGVANMVDVDTPQFDDPVLGEQEKTTYLTDRHNWTGAQVLDTGLAGKPVLLLIRDSFSTALIPFLAGHFSRIIIAHNDDGVWREDLIDRFKPNVVINEVVEGGLRYIMRGGPRPSAQAQGRIAAAPLFQIRFVPSTGPGASIRGGPANDTLTGGPGNDTVRGGRGQDLIFGGPGDDWLSGDRGDDTLWGGPGADVFHSFSGAGLDRVMDFSVEEGDRIVLEAGTTYTVRQEGADTVIDMGGGDRMVLVDVAAKTLKPGTIRRGP